MMNILSLAALWQFFLKDIDLRFALFLIYGFLAPAISISKVAYILKTRKIDQEFEAVFGAENGAPRP
jgi:hypothetical protein